MCAVVRQIAPLAKDLASRDAAEQPSVEITAGPKKDACGVAAVSCLLKETGLLMAVNSTTNAVSVRLSVGRGNDFEVVERTFRPYEVFVANLHHKVSESKVCNENN